MRKVYCFLVPLFCFLPAGCDSVGQPEFTNDRLIVTEPYSLDAVYWATISALEDMQLPLYADIRTAFSARIESETPESQPIYITMQALPENQTEFQILLTSGDRLKTVLIYEKMYRVLYVKRCGLTRTRRLRSLSR